MSYLINDNLIWITTTKTASHSIERALLNSNLKLKRYNEYFNIDKHIHIPLNDCLNYFGNKESICITRNWFEKFLSAINYIWDRMEEYNEYNTEVEPICKWENLNNKIIYETFDTNFINNLYLQTEESTIECLLKLLKNKKLTVSTIKEKNIYIFNNIVTLISEKNWKSNKNCTYEFDIKEMDKFVNFIENRFGEKLIIEHINKSKKRPNKIIINDELKSFVWETFEKPFEKRNQLI